MAFSSENALRSDLEPNRNEVKSSADSYCLVIISFSPQSSGEGARLCTRARLH